MTGITVLTLYAVAAVFLARSVLSERGKHIDLLVGVFAGIAGFLLHASYVYESISGTDLSLGIADTASLIGLAITFVALLGATRPAYRGIAALLIGVAALFALATGSGPAGTPPVAGGWQLKAHILLSVFAYTIMSIATALAVLLTWQQRRLKSKHPGGLNRLLPPLETTERFFFGTMEFGWGLLSLAIFSGLVFVDDLFAQHLAHKTTLSLLAWVVFGLVLLGHRLFGWRGQRAAGLTIAGFAFLALAYFGSKIVLEILLQRHWG